MVDTNMFVTCTSPVHSKYSCFLEYLKLPLAEDFIFETSDLPDIELGFSHGCL